jgi:hypothetical protein
VALHLRPVGPLPPGTYWARRAGVALAVVVPLLLLRSCGDDGSGADTVTPEPTASPSANSTASPRPTATRTAAAVAQCRDADLTAVVAPAPETSPTSFALTVTNRGAVPCTRDLGPGVVDLVVTTGADRFWARSDCDRRTAREVATLAAGASRAVRVGWDGRRSRPGCEGARPVAQPGTYRVEGKVGSKPVAPVVFRVR